MEKIIEFIQNTWIVGIATGIISGIFVHYITVYAINGKKKSEHKKAVECANNAVFDIMQAYIVNMGLPDKKQMDAIINAMSRRYGVKNSEMNSLVNFYEDFIVALVGNLYISNEDKKKKIETLLESIEVLNKDTMTKEPYEAPQADKIKKFQMAGILSGALSALCSILAGLVLSSSGEAKFNFVVGIIGVGSVAVSIVIAIITIVENWFYWRIPKNVKRYKKNIIDSYLVDRRFLLMSNHGADINEAFNGSYAFINYFKEDE